MKRSFFAALAVFLSVACSLGGSENTAVVTPSPRAEPNRSAHIPASNADLGHAFTDPNYCCGHANPYSTCNTHLHPNTHGDDATDTATATATATATEIHYPTPPDRDLYDLTSRLVIKSQRPIPRVVNPMPVAYEVGRQDTFNVTDIANRDVYPLQATLHVVTDHAYWYIADGVQFNLDDLENSRQKVFEEEIYPRVTAVFGTELVPGVDNDVHLTVLHAPLSGVAGYYSSADEYPSTVHPHSNQREMIYMTSSLLLNSRSYLACFGSRVHSCHPVSRRRFG